jgi:hypothetical protein
MRPIDWIFMTLIGGTGLALAVLGLVVWSESRWMSVVMIAVGGGVVFLASFVGPEEHGRPSVCRICASRRATTGTTHPELMASASATRR